MEKTSISSSYTDRRKIRSIPRHCARKNYGERSIRKQKTFVAE